MGPKPGFSVSAMRAFAAHSSSVISFICRGLEASYELEIGPISRPHSNPADAKLECQSRPSSADTDLGCKYPPAVAGGRPKEWPRHGPATVRQMSGAVPPYEPPAPPYQGSVHWDGTLAPL